MCIDVYGVTRFRSNLFLLLEGFKFWPIRDNLGQTGFPPCLLGRGQSLENMYKVGQSLEKYVQYVQCLIVCVRCTVKHLSIIYGNIDCLQLTFFIYLFKSSV